MDSNKPERALDLNIALAHVDGDSQLLSQLALLFLQDYSRLIEEARAAILQRDDAVLERAAHTLKGRLAFFGVHGLRDQVSDLEMMGRVHDLSRAGEALAGIEAGMASVLAEFQSLVVP